MRVPGPVATALRSVEPTHMPTRVAGQHLRPDPRSGFLRRARRTSRTCGLGGAGNSRLGRWRVGDLPLNSRRCEIGPGDLVGEASIPADVCECLHIVLVLLFLCLISGGSGSAEITVARPTAPSEPKRSSPSICRTRAGWLDNPTSCRFVRTLPSRSLDCLRWQLPNELPAKQRKR